jgi:hypothetical protein
VGRGSFTEAFPLFGLDLADYDELFEEKLELLLHLRSSPTVRWSGRHRPALTGQAVYPRPLQDPLPIWVGVGGTPSSFVRAGALGLPLMVAIIGGEPRRFAPLVELYREAGRRAGHAPERLRVGLHCFGFLGPTTQEAADAFHPGWEELFTKVSRERGFAPPSRAQFDAMLGPTGAFFVGDPATVAEKVRSVSRDLGGVERINLQMTNPRLAHGDLLRSIELLGTQVRRRWRDGDQPARVPAGRTSSDAQAATTSGSDDSAQAKSRSSSAADGCLRSVAASTLGCSTEGSTTTHSSTSGSSSSRSTPRTPGSSHPCSPRASSVTAAPAEASRR